MILLHSLFASLLISPICSGAPLVDWDFSQTEKHPHLKVLGGATLVSSQHATTSRSVSVSPLTGGGSLVSSTYQSVANALNVARFNKPGIPGYLEFTIHNQSESTLKLSSIHLEAMRNGPNAPKALKVTIDYDGNGFQDLSTPQAFPISEDRVFSTLQFTQALRFKRQATIRIQSANANPSTGNLHIRKLTVHHTDQQKTAKAATSSLNTSALISFAGISLHLQ